MDEDGNELSCWYIHQITLLLRWRVLLTSACAASGTGEPSSTTSADWTIPLLRYVNGVDRIAI
jgi:hypothetical protein